MQTNLITHLVYSNGLLKYIYELLFLNIYYKNNIKKYVYLNSKKYIKK